jgi:hypothetical protein
MSAQTQKGGEGLCNCTDCFCMFYSECDCDCCCGEIDDENECQTHGHNIEDGECTQCGGILRAEPHPEAEGAK